MAIGNFAASDVLVQDTSHGVDEVDCALFSPLVQRMVSRWKDSFMGKEVKLGVVQRQKSATALSSFA